MYGPPSPCGACTPQCGAPIWECTLPSGEPPPGSVHPPVHTWECTLPGVDSPRRSVLPVGSPQLGVHSPMESPIGKCAPNGGVHSPEGTPTREYLVYQMCKYRGTHSQICKYVGMHSQIQKYMGMVSQTIKARLVAVVRHGWRAQPKLPRDSGTCNPCPARPYRFH